MFKRYLLYAIALLPCVSFASNSNNPPSGYSEYFTLGVDALRWKESPPQEGSTNEWTNEEGVLVSLDYIYGTEWKADEGYFYRQSQRMYFGAARYRAYGKALVERDRKGESLYVGFDYSRHWGYRYPLTQTLSISPVFGLGLDATGKGKMGQVSRVNEKGKEEKTAEHELIASLYANAGLMLTHNLDEGKRVSLEAGLHRPLVNLQYHHSASLLRPRNATGNYLSLTYYGRGKGSPFVRLDYLNKKYQESSRSSENWYQPDTSRETLGLTLGWNL